MHNRSRARRVLTTIIAGVTLAAGLAVTHTDSATAAGRKFYVGCSGSDSASGRSASNAWRSIDRANDAELLPGDRLLLERGCNWNGQRLDVVWSGTASNPIVIANYGSGAKPRIRNGKNSSVKITGSHVVVRGLRVDHNNLPTVACDQPIENVYGFNITGGAHHVTIKYSEASGSTAGIHISKNSGNNVIENNKIFDNDVLTTWGSDPSKDLGAWGVLVRSDGNRISDNRFYGNRARCRNQGFKLMSNSVEIFEGDDNLILRNRSNDRVFSELGSSSSDIAEGNIYEFNVHDSDIDDARFITTRGSDAPFGPVRSTRVVHNTIHLTGYGSQGIICGGTCGGGILEVRNNVIVAAEKTIFASGNAQIGTNLVWNTEGEVFWQIGTNGDETPPGLIAADPRFVNEDKGNVRLRAESPAIGLSDGYRLEDIDFTGDPITGNGDLGAFDR